MTLLSLKSGIYEDVLEETVAELNDGRCVILPTDTVYGLAARADMPAAVSALFGYKSRSAAKAIAVLVSSIDDMDGLCGHMSSDLVALLNAFWPGGLTIVVDRGIKTMHWNLGGDPTSMGVRCTNSDFVRDVASRVGPLATTSANRSGRPTPVLASELASEIGDENILVIDGGTLSETASTVLDVRGEVWRVLRAGRLNVDGLRNVVDPARPIDAGGSG